MKTPRSILLISLHSGSWGRAQLARHVAQSLAAAGHDVTLLMLSNTSALSNQGAWHTIILDEVCGSRLEKTFGLLRDKSYDLAIHCDGLSSANFLWQHRLNLSLFEGLGRHSMIVDTWDLEKCGTMVDIAGFKTLDLARSPYAIKFLERHRNDRLIPAPLTYRNRDNRTFSAIPAPSDGTARRLPTHHPKILLCTGAWQTVESVPSAIAKVVTGLLEVIAIILKEIALPIELIHVGPQPADALSQLDHYRWLPPLTWRAFEELLDEVNLLLTANIASFAITRALARGTSIVCIQNSRWLTGVPELNDGGNQSALTQAFESMIPIFPFHVWPMGYFDFLEPLLVNNPLTECMEIVELSDMVGIAESISALLSDRRRTDNLRARQRDYCEDLNQGKAVTDVLNNVLLEGYESSNHHY